MNIFLWVMQILLAVHTVVGALWKFSTSEKHVPSLEAMPHEVWLALGVLEIFCSAALIAPAVNKRLAILAPIAAGFIAAEMLLFTAVHLRSGSPNHGFVVYWLVVAALCIFLAYTRLGQTKLAKNAL